MSSNIVFAQDVKSVDVKSVPQSDIQKAQKAMQDAGLSTQDAANLARQKGATEQQIQDFENRIQGGDNAGSSTPSNQEVISDPVQDAVRQLDELPQEEKKKEEEKSTRSGTFNTTGSVFGNYLFNSNNLTFEPSLNIQTPKNYEIGIGDQIIINIWGNSQQNYQLTVNKNGQITIPDVGPIYIAGATFDDAENKIIKRLTSIYADMGGINPQTFAQVNMGQLRSIQVNLVGEVGSPGTYTLPVTATAFNALYLSGGPNNIGSFRNIKIIRDNKVFKTIDIYKFLVDADPSDNILLKESDIIFVPPVEKRVKITGEFKRNGLFEMKEGENLNELIRFAGGFTVNSYLSKLQIYRKTQQGSKIIDVPLTEAGSNILQNGDEVRNKPIEDKFENRVTISGSVTRPGEYEWQENMRLSDLISKADSITPDAYLKGGHIIRYNPDLTQQLITFTLDDVISGAGDYILFPEDVVSIKSNFQMMENNTVTIAGHVMTPGTFPFMDSITVADAIYLANGLREGALETGHVIRVKPDRTYTFIKFNTTDVLNGLGDFPLKKEDIVNIKSRVQLKEIPTISVAGEVKNPAQFNYMENMKLYDALYLANGFTEGADSSFIEIARRLSYKEESRLTDTLVHLYTSSATRDLKSNGSDFILEPYDQVYVRRAPGYRKQGSASITGEVKYAGIFAISRNGQRISDLLKMAGGITPQAYINGATLQRFTDELGTEQVAIDLNQIINNPGSEADLFLNNGDRIFIPEFMQTVKITGSIQNPFSVTFETGKSAKYYINRSGGFNSDANKKKTYVRYANGTTAVTKSFIVKSYPKVQPGSQIIVPQKPEKKAGDSGRWLAFASVLASLAVSIATVVSLTK